MQCRKFRKGKKSAKKMRRRKLQKKCNSENATLEVAFFRILRCICFGAVAFLFAFFMFFFVKKIQKLIKVAKKCSGENATSQVAKKMQRRKCNVGSCIFFAFSVPWFLAFAFSVAFLDFPDLLQLALWFCLEFSRERMLLIEGGTATSLGARRHIAQELPGSLHVSLSFGQFQS